MTTVTSNLHQLGSKTELPASLDAAKLELEGDKLLADMTAELEPEKN